MKRTEREEVREGVVRSGEGGEVGERGGEG